VMMSNGPHARVGSIMPVDLPRPRSRDALLAHPDYYGYRERLLEFLEAYEGGADPSPELLEAIAARRPGAHASNETAHPPAHPPVRTTEPAPTAPERLAS